MRTGLRLTHLLAWAAIGLTGVAWVASSACDTGGTTRAFVPTATPGAFAEPTATPAPPPRAGSATAPFRWGYDPSRPSGGHDPPPEFEPLPPGYRIETYVTGLTQPTAISFLPDGRMLVAEQAGAIRVVEDGTLLAEPLHQIDVYRPNTRNNFTELGLVGIAVDPAYRRNRQIYVYYSADQPQRRTVLARLQLDGGGRVRRSKEILSLEAAPKCCHIAGSLRFAPDGRLFVTIGDHQMEVEAQNRGSAFGSILRISRDGGVPSDNPFAGDRKADGRVYAYGLRNPFDVAIDPLSGAMYGTENGLIGQDAIIRVKPGANYGWPGFELSVRPRRIEQPMLFYHQATGPAGIEFYRGRELPALDGTLLFCQFHRGGALHVVTFLLNGEPDQDRVIATGCTSDVVQGPDGLVYFVDYLGGVIYRIARG